MIITKLMKSDKSCLDEMRKENKKIFSDEFTVTKFTTEYVKAIQTISATSREKTK